jgi:chloride channel 3/4/5
MVNEILTIMLDWVQDAARAQLRRKARRQDQAGRADLNGRYAWRRRFLNAYDAGQAWIVVTLVGIAIGLNAAFLNIVTEWLSDIKLGYCTTAFYLNESFCCWGAESGRLLRKAYGHYTNVARMS